MCAGAIINSRIRRVVYGAADTKAGCCGSVTDLFAMPFNHHPVVEQGSARRGRHRRFAGVFQRPAGTACGQAEVETACMTGAWNMKKTVKKWKLREKVGGFHFLFSANCAILFNGVLSKPILCSCLQRRAPDFDRIRNGR